VKLALAIVVAVVLALVVAVRIPRSAEVLEDVPGLGWLVELIGANHEGELGPEEIRYRADHPEQLARVHLPNTEVHGDMLVIHAHDALDAMSQRDHLTAGPPGPFYAYVVVYQSDELTALQRALRKDDQAKKLGISVELDHVGYHLQIPGDGMYVNPDWAEQHHCDTRDRIVGTGVYCIVPAAARLSAYLDGDPGLFTDPHPLDVPAGRTFLPDDVSRNERFYEVQMPAMQLQPSDLRPREDGLDVIAAVPAAATASDVELVVQISGKLYLATPIPGGLHIATGPVLADELATYHALAAAGLHELAHSENH